MGLEKIILDKLTAKSLGLHLHNYANLFIRPLTVWRKILNIQKTSYDLFILHLIYYSLLILFIVKDDKLAIRLTFLEILTTTIPWLIFILPFKFFTSKFKLRFNAVRLFRILMIIKLQCIPISLLLILSAYYFKLDILFTFFENFICVPWILFIAVIPLFAKIKLVHKIIWILSNYIFASIFLLMCSFVYAEFPEELSVFDKKISVFTPDREYSEYKEQSMNSFYYLDDSYFLLIAFNDRSSHKNSTFELRLTSAELISAFLKRDVNDRLDRVKQSGVIDEFVEKHPYYPKEEELTIDKLVVFENRIDRMFNKDIELVKKYSDSTIFPSNGKYFSTLLSYYQLYKNAVSDANELKNIVKTKNLFGSVVFNDTMSGYLFNIKNNQYSKIKSDIKIQEERLEKRLMRSTFCFEVMFYPIDAFIDYIIENE